MPADLQASISSVPAGAVSFWPSTVKFTSGIGSLCCLLREVVGMNDAFRQVNRHPFDLIVALFWIWIELGEIDGLRYSGRSLQSPFVEVLQLNGDTLAKALAGEFESISRADRAADVRRPTAPIVFRYSFVDDHVDALHLRPACLRIEYANLPRSLPE